MRAIDHVIEHFPESAVVVRRLYLKDEGFREACEDYAASLASLRLFEARDDAHLRPEIQDYRNLLSELEDELRKYISSERGAEPLP